MKQRTTRFLVIEKIGKQVGTRTSLVYFLLLFALVNHTFGQTYIWAKNIGAPGFSSSACLGFEITADVSGNSYVTGAFSNIADFDPGQGVATLTATGLSDIFLAKYDPSGNYKWAIKLGGPAQDYPGNVCVDPSGNVYVLGIFNGTVDFDPGVGTATMTSSNRLFLAKYDANGNYLWAISICKCSFVGDLAIDPSGNILITGGFLATDDFDPGPGTALLTPLGLHDIFIAKYTNAGNYIWAGGMGGIGYDYSFGIDLDTSGNVYITGGFNDIVDFDPGPGVAQITSFGSADAFFAKYNSNGIYQWARAVGSSSLDFGRDVKVDRTGNIYITGGFRGISDFDPASTQFTANSSFTAASAGDLDIYLAKYDISGNFKWARCMGSDTVDNSMRVALDCFGEPIIAGAFCRTVDFDPGPATATRTANGLMDGFLAKYDTAGNVQWAGNFGSLQNMFACNGLAVDQNSNVFITGFYYGGADFDPGPGTASLSTSNSNNMDVFIAKYGSHGNFTIIPSANPICLGTSVTLSSTATGSVLWSTGSSAPAIVVTPTALTTYSLLSSFTSGSTTCNLSASVSVSVTVCTELHPGISEHYVYVFPNPTAGNLTLRFENVQEREIKVFDSFGSLLQHHRATSAEVTLDISDQEDGLYFISLTEPGNVFRQIKIFKIE